jgi:hypothetical protein
MRNVIYVLMFVFLSGCVNDNNSTEQSDTSDNQTEIENQSGAEEESEGNSNKSSKSKTSQLYGIFLLPKHSFIHLNNLPKGRIKVLEINLPKR